MNSSISFNDTLNKMDVPDHFLMFKLVVQISCVLIITSGIIGNILVLAAFLARWKDLKTYEMFIVTLAFVDLLSTVLLPCIQLHEIRGGSFKAIGSIGCKILYFLSNFCITVSSLILTMVSIERFIAVQWPFLERKRISKWLILTTWFIALVFSASIYLINDGVLLHYDAEKTHVCRLLVSIEEVTIISLTTTALQNAIPIIIMTILYSFIVIKLYANSNNYTRHLNRTELQTRNKNLRKTTKLLFIVVVVFFVCVTPSNVFYILYNYDKHGLPDEYVYPVYVILTMLMMSNACANPMIYGKLHTSFRKQVTELIRYFLYSRCIPTNSVCCLFRKNFKRKILVLGEEKKISQGEVTDDTILSSSVKLKSSKKQKENQISTNRNASRYNQFDRCVVRHFSYKEERVKGIDKAGGDLDEIWNNVNRYIHSCKGPETIL